MCQAVAAPLLLLLHEDLSYVFVPSWSDVMYCTATWRAIE
jgi:hypothetical protein